jgi:hypothetical protein
MPELSWFYGVRSKMCSDDHDPPYYNAEDAGDDALISIDALGVIAGGVQRQGGRLHLVRTVLSAPAFATLLLQMGGQ